MPHGEKGRPALDHALEPEGEQGEAPRPRRPRRGRARPLRRRGRRSGRAASASAAGGRRAPPGPRSGGRRRGIRRLTPAFYAGGTRARRRNTMAPRPLGRRNAASDENAPRGPGRSLVAAGLLAVGARLRPPSRARPARDRVAAHRGISSAHADDAPHDCPACLTHGGRARSALGRRFVRRESLRRPARSRRSPTAPSAPRSPAGTSRAARLPPRS